MHKIKSLVVTVFIVIIIVLLTILFSTAWYGVIKAGKVTNVTLHGSQNIIKSIEVREGITKKISISKEFIASIGDNVFLNVAKNRLS